MLRFFLSIILILSFIFFPIRDSFAITAQEMRNQIYETNKQIEELDKEIKKYQNQIAATSEEANTLANLIKELTLTRSKLVAERQQIEKKIKATGLVINELEGNISEQEKSINQTSQAIKESIVYIYENDNTSFMEKFLSQDSFTNASREYNNILDINEKLGQYVKEIRQEKEDLVVSKNQKEEEHKNLTALKTNLSQKELAVNLAKKEKDTLLAKTKNKESEYKKLLEEQIKKRDAFEKALENYEAQLEFILNPKSIPKRGSEVFSWPLDYVFITQMFGKTSASGRLYASGSHSGMDMRASIGTPVKSMADGVVEGTGDTDVYCKGASFGKWVFIKYSNGLSSTFGHLSAITAKTGQKVKAGDTVGLSGNTGHSTGPHLHVTVYASEGAKVDKVPSLSCSGKTFIMPIAATSAYLDPLDYLPKITSSMVKK